MLKAFPKIFTLGTSYVEGVLDSEVEITEKIDGSQFVFGKLEDKMYYRSKGKEQYADSADAMFKCGIEYIENIQEKLPNGVAFYSEILQKPKHNTLKYDRTPKNHIALFGISEQYGSKFWSSHAELALWAETLGIDVVPKIFYGIINAADEIVQMLDRESFLGGAKIEGVVVKNYNKQFLLGGQPIPVMAAKYVSEAFKEVHRSQWKSENTGKGKWETFKEGYRTEARWAKAVQHLADKGELLNDPKDIAALIKEVQNDIREEETEEIKAFLWKEFGSELLRRSTAGLPEWYKNTLLENSFNKKENENA